MVKNTVEIKARIGMALALADFLTEVEPNSRMNNLMGRLKSQCIKRLSYLIGARTMSASDEKLVRDNMATFWEVNSWGKEPKNLFRYCTFLLTLFREYPEDGIIKVLEDISEFLRQGDWKPVCAFENMAFEKWEGIWGE
jgi:hypothetical protein